MKPTDLDEPRSFRLYVAQNHVLDEMAKDMGAEWDASKMLRMILSLHMGDKLPPALRPTGGFARMLREE